MLKFSPSPDCSPNILKPIMVEVFPILKQTEKVLKDGSKNVNFIITYDNDIYNDDARCIYAIPKDEFEKNENFHAEKALEIFNYKTDNGKKKNTGFF